MKKIRVLMIDDNVNLTEMVKEYFDNNNTVMVHIRRLREKIEMDSRNAQIIKTVWGVGYKIDK